MKYLHPFPTLGVPVLMIIIALKSTQFLFIILNVFNELEKLKMYSVGFSTHI